MPVDDIRERKLVELYHRYIGEPESKRDVYGYWLLLLGSVTGICGVLVYQIQQVLLPGDFGVREIAIALAAVGLALGLFAIVVLLPVRRRGMQASLVGLGIAFLGILAFALVYPQDWYVGPVDYSAEIIAVYTTGIGIIVAVAILVPIVTGEKGLLVEPELGLGADDAPILVGDSDRDAFFSVYETPTNEWTWRTIQRDAVGRSATTVATDTDARMQVETVREKIATAGLLDITTAAFRLYQTEAGNWDWSLVTGDGNIIARSDSPYDGRDGIESAVNFLKEEAPAADIVEIQGAAFDVYADDGDRWHWELIDAQHRPLATGVDTYGEEDAAEAAIAQFIEWVDNPRVLALEAIGIELFDTEAGWQWRIIDAADRRLVASADAFDTRGDAEMVATDMAEDLSDATLIEHGTPGFEVYNADAGGADARAAPDRGGGWSWRLRDEADTIIARAHAQAASADKASARAERTKAVVPDADIIEFDGLDYEVYPTEFGWRWRLVTVERNVLAASATEFDTQAAVETAADRVREQAQAAELLEFDQAAFQQYESDGEWRWRLIDEDGQVMADSGESYEDKAAVMEGMQTLKENAPDAEVLEIDTAAFEIYQTDGDEYTWRLIDEAGQLIAESASRYPSRSAARDAVEVLLAHNDEAAVRAVDNALFQLTRDAESWRFWLLDIDGTVLAEPTESYPTYDDVTSAIDAMRAAGEKATIATLGAVTVQLRQDGNYHYQLLARDRTVVGESDRTYEARADAEADIDRLTAYAKSAPVFDIGRGVIWLRHRDDEWEWQLVDADRTELAAGPQTYPTQDAAMEDIEQVQARAADADRLDIETLAFEPVHEPDSAGDDADDDGWRWQLIDEDGGILAVSVGQFESRDAVTDAIETARTTTGTASILEIDEVTFEFAERDEGWIWRLIDENGSPIAESVRPHETRQAAREEMMAMKTHAPEGETVVSW